MKGIAAKVKPARSMFRRVVLAISVQKEITRTDAEVQAIEIIGKRQELQAVFSVIDKLNPYYCYRFDLKSSQMRTGFSTPACAES